MNFQVIITEPGRVLLREQPLSDRLTSCQVLVKCLYSLISPGTELAMLMGTHMGISDPTNRFAKFPFVPGYAAVGEILGIGEDITEFSRGDIVCYLGQHQSYAVIEPDTIPVVRVPRGMPLPYIPFARIGQIAHVALAVSEAYVGDPVAVLGLGLVGNMTAQLFHIQGMRVFGIDHHFFRRNVVERLGITPVTASTDADLVAHVIQAIGDDGTRTTVEASGAPNAVSLALDMTRKGGQVVLLGSTRGLVCIDIYGQLHRKGLSVKGAHEDVVFSGVSGACHVREAVLKDTLDLINNERLVIAPLVSRIISPSSIHEGYRLVSEQKNEVVGVLIDWT